MLNRDWQLLKVLYQEKNITKSANKLFISQPAVTKRIQHIEKKFDVQIMDRGRTGVHFTPQGEYLVKCAEEMTNRMKEIKMTVSSMDARIKGTLKIGVSHSFARKMLPKILSKYQELYPDVEFDIVTGWSNEIFKLLCHKEIQVAFVRGGYKWGQSKKLLFKESIYIISSKEIQLHDLYNMKRIEYNSDPKLKAVIGNWWRENFSEMPLKGIKVNNSDTCKEMVVQGLGYSIVPGFILKENDKLFKIQLTNRKGEALKRETWMFNYEELNDLNIGRSFIDIVESMI